MQATETGRRPAGEFLVTLSPTPPRPEEGSGRKRLFPRLRPGRETGPDHNVRLGHQHRGLLPAALRESRTVRANSCGSPTPGLTAAHAMAAEFLRGCEAERVRSDGKASRGRSTRAGEPPPPSTHTPWRRSGEAHAPGRPPRPSGSPPCPRAPHPRRRRSDGRLGPPRALPPSRPDGAAATQTHLALFPPPRSQWLVAGGRVPGRRLPATPAARTDADRRFSRLRFEKCSRVLGGGRWTSGDSARSRPRANRSARRGWGRHVGGRGEAPASRAC